MTEPDHQPDVVLPPPDYTDVFGVPNEVLQQCTALSNRADRGDITLLQWREQFAALLADYPEARAVSEEERRALTGAAADMALGSSTDPAWDELDRDDAKIRAWSLFTHAAALAGPPTDEELHERLAQVEREIKRPDASIPADLRERHAAQARESRQTILRWMAEADEQPRDAETGIPLAEIEPHLTREHPVLGEVPVPRRVAVAKAWLASSVEERAVATAVGRSPHVRETDWKSAEAFGEIRPSVVTEFLSFLADSDDPSAQAVMREWTDGTLRDLVRDFFES